MPGPALVGANQLAKKAGGEFYLGTSSAKKEVLGQEV